MSRARGQHLILVVVALMSAGCIKRGTSQTPTAETSGVPPPTTTGAVGATPETNAQKKPARKNVGSGLGGSASKVGPNGKAYDPKASMLDSDPTYEEVSWDQAKAWWPYRPLLRAEWTPIPNSEEALIANGSPKNPGLKSDPKSEFTSLDIYYQYPPFTIRNTSMWDLVDEGRIIVLGVTYYPPGMDAPYADKAMWGIKPVIVRGQPGGIFEIRRANGSNRDWRMILWQQSAGRGTIQWRVGSNPLTYTEEQMLDFTERLVVVE